MADASDGATPARAGDDYSAWAATPQPADPHKPVPDDVRLLGGLLGDTLRRQEAQALFDRVLRVRGLAKARPSDVSGGFDDLSRELAGIPVDAATPVGRVATRLRRMRRPYAVATSAGSSCGIGFRFGSPAVKSPSTGSHAHR